MVSRRTAPVKGYCKDFCPQIKNLEFYRNTKENCIFNLQKGCVLGDKTAASQSGERFGTRVFKIWIYHFRRAAATHGRYISASAAAMAGRKPRI